jgi:hypothetical protein
VPENLKDLDYFALAKKRKDAAAAFWKDMFDDFDTDNRLTNGDQWKEADRNARENSGRPALQFNRQANNVQLITNTNRANKPSIRVNPVSDATVEQAKYYQGIIRHIEYISRADMCREMALEPAVTGGFGHYRLTTKYVSPEEPDPFAQDIYLEPIANPKSVLWDPSVFKKLDFRGDARWCQVLVRMTWEEYQERFPNAQNKAWEDSEDWGDWADRDGVTVCEYWQVKVKRRKRYALRVFDPMQGGWATQQVYADELEKQPGSEVIVNQRDEETREVVCDLINGVEVLESTKWAGDWIPILTVLGKAVIVDGRQKLIGLVRNNRDSQQLLNAACSGIAENIGLTNRVPYTGPKGSFRSDKNWGNAHVTNPAYLEWDPVTGPDGVTVLPSPERQSAEAAVGALSQLAMMMADSIKAESGIFDSSLGAAPAEYSGVSVEKRTQQANLINLHYTDNLSRTMWDEGTMLLQLIRRVYDRPRAIRILGEDGIPDMIPVTMEVEMPDGTRQVPEVPGFEGKQHLRLDKGTFDVRITTGPSYPTKKLEEFYAWKEMAGQDPLLMQSAGDLIYKNAPFEGAEAIAESYLSIMPPSIQELRRSKAGEAQPQQLKVQIAQLTAQLQQLQAENQMLKIERETEIHKIQAENERNDRNNETKLVLEAMKQDFAKQQDLFKAEIASIQQRLSMLHESEMYSSPQEQAEAQAMYQPNPNGAGSVE